MLVANLFLFLCNEQWVASIDMAANEEANENVIVKMSESFTEQAAQVSWQRFITALQSNRRGRGTPQPSANVRCKCGNSWL